MTDIDSPPPYSESNGLSAVANGNTASTAVATTAAASAAPASSDSAHAQPSTLAVADVSPTPTAGLRSTSAGGSSAAVAVVEQGEEVKSEDAKTGQVAQEEDGMDEQFELGMSCGRSMLM